MLRPKTSVIKIEISWETDAKLRSKIPFEGFGDNLNSVIAFSSMEFELQTAGDVYILLMLQVPSAEKPAATKHEEAFEGNPLKV